MKKLLFVLFSFCLFSVSAVFAQEETSETLKVSLDEAVQLALKNNTSVKRQSIALNTLEKKSDYSWNNLIPTASVSGNYQTNFLEPVTSSWSVNGSLSLRLGPSLFTTIRAARLNYESGLADYDSTLSSVELSVRKTFLNLLYYKENLNLQKKSLETSRQRYISNKEKYNRGQLSELDLLEAQYNYESMKPAIETLEINYANMIAGFKQSLGLSQEAQIELTGTLDEYYEKTNLDVTYNLEELPAIKKIDRQISSAKNSLLATRFTAWGPSVSASYSYSVSGSENAPETTKRDSLSVGVSIPLDGFLPWSSGALSVDSQKANVQDLELQKESQLTSTKVEIETLIKQIKQAQLQLETLKSNVTLAQKKYNMTLTAYNHGSKDLLTLQNASVSLLNSKISVQSQMYTIITLVMDLENKLGVPYGTLCEKNNNQ